MSSDFVGRPRDGESSTAVPEGHIAALQSQSSEITQSESRPASTNTNHANSDPTTNQLQLQQQPQPEPSTSLYHEPTHHELLASELRPTTDSTLTIRVIKSFEFRTQKSLVVKGVNLGEETVGGLMARVREGEYASGVPVAIALLWNACVVKDWFSRDLDLGPCARLLASL